MEQIIGGAIIGIGATFMLLFTGRVTGISGILGGIISSTVSDKSWRVLFILGLLLGGVFFLIVNPDVFFIKTSSHKIDYIIAGFLVGVGTLLGNGCTSGHGVCGISRFSIRSIIATVTFIISGVVSVLIFKYLRGEV